METILHKQKTDSDAKLTKNQSKDKLIKKPISDSEVTVNMFDFDTLIQQTILNSMRLKEYFRLNLLYYQLVSGKGLEFDRIKEYYVGADPKRIDWKKNAKTQKLDIRVFKEERHFDIVIVIDVSDTMLLGTTNVTKNEFAALIAGVLAYAAVEANDNIAICLMSEKTKIFPDPSSEFYSFMNILADKNNYGGGKNWNELTKYMLGNYSQESIIFLISDFIDTNANLFVPDLASQFAKVYGIMVRDPTDDKLPDNVGKMYIKGMSGGASLLADFDKLQAEYELLNKRQTTKLREIFRQYNQLFFSIRPGEDFGKEFIKALGSEEVIIW